MQQTPSWNSSSSSACPAPDLREGLHELLPVRDRVGRAPAQAVRVEVGIANLVVQIGEKQLSRCSRMRISIAAGRHGDPHGLAALDCADEMNLAAPPRREVRGLSGRVHDLVQRDQEIARRRQLLLERVCEDRHLRPEQIAGTLVLGQETLGDQRGEQVVGCRDGETGSLRERLARAVRALRRDQRQQRRRARDGLKMRASRFGPCRAVPSSATPAWPRQPPGPASDPERRARAAVRAHPRDDARRVAGGRAAARPRRTGPFRDGPAGRSGNACGSGSRQAG